MPRTPPGSRRFISHPKIPPATISAVANIRPGLLKVGRVLGREFRSLTHDAGALFLVALAEKLARRQFARFGAHLRRVAGKRTDAIDVGFGADALDRLHGEIERKTACRRIARYDQIFWPDTT